CLRPATAAPLAARLSAGMRRSRSLGSLALGLVFPSSALHVAAGLSEQLGFLRRISVFSYPDAAAIAERGGLAGGDALVMLLLSVLCVAGAIGYYRIKDIAG